MEDLTAEHTGKGLHTREAWLLVCTDPPAPADEVNAWWTQGPSAVPQAKIWTQRAHNLRNHFKSCVYFYIGKFIFLLLKGQNLKKNPEQVFYHLHGLQIFPKVHDILLV